MGYDQVGISIVAHVSRHNDPRDAEDDLQWAELAARVREVAEDLAYLNLNVIYVGPMEGEGA